NELRGRDGSPRRHYGVEARGLRPAERGVPSALGIAGPKVALDLSLDPLERVVDRLHLTLQEGGDLVVALAVGVEPQHLRLELREKAVERGLDVAEVLRGDHDLGRVEHRGADENV